MLLLLFTTSVPISNDWVFNPVSTPGALNFQQATSGSWTVTADPAPPEFIQE